MCHFEATFADPGEEAAFFQSFRARMTKVRVQNKPWVGVLLNVPTFGCDSKLLPLKSKGGQEVKAPTWTETQLQVRGQQHGCRSPLALTLREVAETPARGSCSPVMARGFLLTCPSLCFLVCQAQATFSPADIYQTWPANVD